MHFRCVFTYLQTYVLVGLDWAKPMMILSLHVTCLSIFSCIHTFISLYSYIKLFWCFSTCLSLSLPLSVCIMAPKRKFTPSRNPLHSRASSSDPSPSHLWFHDEKARKDFLKNFSWRGFHSERQVILLDFSDTNLPTVIYSRGWKLLGHMWFAC